MSTIQISKVDGSHRHGANGSTMKGHYGKLNGSIGALAKEINLRRTEEASSWQDKMKESHLKHVLLRSELLQKRKMRQYAT